MTPTLDIIHYLIEQYFDNNGGREDYDQKEPYFVILGDKIKFDWLCGIDKFGNAEWADEHFIFTPAEKITNLESYVNEVIERILKVPYFDDRPRGGDPRYGC